MYVALQMYLVVGWVMAVRAAYRIRPAKFRDMRDACTFTIAITLFALFWPLAFFWNGEDI